MNHKKLDLSMDKYAIRNLLNTCGMMLRVREMEIETFRTVTKTEDGRSRPREGWNNKEKQSRAENGKKEGNGWCSHLFLCCAEIQRVSGISTTTQTQTCGFRLTQLVGTQICFTWSH